jgi:hypothetical protein
MSGYVTVLYDMSFALSCELVEQSKRCFSRFPEEWGVGVSYGHMTQNNRGDYRVLPLVVQ